MTSDDNNPAGAGPVKAQSSDAQDRESDSALDDAPPPASDPAGAAWQPPQGPPPSPQHRKEIPEDLRVPWGWPEVGLFVILGVIASVVVTWGLAEMTVWFFGAKSTDVFGSTMSTAKSVVVLVSQALLDGGAILYLYLILLNRTSAPFWKSIGWREMRPGMGTIRSSATRFLAGGAMLALVVTFAGSFFNSKQALPIEELLKARVSVLLFAILGVLVAPLVEETIFRGFLYPVIARRLGITAGIAITGTLFGLMHAAQLWGGWGQIGLLILVGIVLTWVRARTGTVAASYFVHLGYNGLQLIGFLIFLISGARH